MLQTSLIQREQTEYEKRLKQIEEVNKINEQYKKQRETAASQIRRGQLSERAQKARELFNKFCICGQGAQFKGYCFKCIEKLKNEYKEALQKYQPIAENYQNLYVNNINIESKLIKMKKKIEKYKKKAAFIDNNDDEDLEEKLMNDEINFLKQSIKQKQAEIIMNKNENERDIKEKYFLQQDIEKKLIKKSEKINILNKLLEQYDTKINEVKKKIEDY